MTWNHRGRGPHRCSLFCRWSLVTLRELILVIVFCCAFDSCLIHCHFLINKCSFWGNTHSHRACSIPQDHSDYRGSTWALLELPARLLYLFQRPVEVVDSEVWRCPVETFGLRSVSVTKMHCGVNTHGYQLAFCITAFVDAFPPRNCPQDKRVVVSRHALQAGRPVAAIIQIPDDPRWHVESSQVEQNQHICIEKRH